MACYLRSVSDTAEHPVQVTGIGAPMFLDHTCAGL